MLMNRRIMKTLRALLLIIVTLCTLKLSAQITCVATAPSKVGISQAIQYSVKLNQKATQITAQNFGSFTKINGPSQSYSSSTSVINGQVSSSTEYTYIYTLQPTKLGQQTIPGVTFVVDGKQVKSNSVTVVVTQENQQTQQNSRSRQSRIPSFFNEPSEPAATTTSKDDLILKAFASISSPYQGEEVIVTHKLYISSNIHNFQPTSTNFPSQPDLWSYTLGDPKAEAKHSTEVLNGKRYDVYELRRTAVYPQKSGQIVITPLELEGVAVIPYGFFGQQKNMKVKSNAVTLQVKPLPTNGRPADFSGLVGKFTMESSLTKSTLSTNDATDLLVTIKGSGNLQHIENLNFNFPTDFDVADPSTNDKINTNGNGVSGSRVFDYVIMPRVAGTFTIPAATFSYFDIATKTYKTLSTPDYSVTVTKGNNDGVTNSAFQKDVQVLDKDIRFIKTDKDSFHPKSGVFFATTNYFILLFLPLILFVLFLIIWSKYIENQRNVSQVRNRRANKVARKKLNKARKFLNNNSEDEFYVEISQALWGYIGDKFHILQSELSMDTVRQKLTEKGAAAEDIEEFINTLNECEFARFAPNNGTEMMSRLYNLSVDFITKIEKK